MLIVVLYEPLHILLDLFTLAARVSALLAVATSLLRLLLAAGRNALLILFDPVRISHPLGDVFVVPLFHGGGLLGTGALVVTSQMAVAAVVHGLPSLVTLVM
jgi:hypothetical protein